MFLGHPALLGSVTLELVMSPPFEQRCWHLYFIVKQRAPNPHLLTLRD